MKLNLTAPAGWWWILNDLSQNSWDIKKGFVLLLVFHKFRDLHMSCLPTPLKVRGLLCYMLSVGIEDNK